MAQLAEHRYFSDTVVLGCGRSNRGNYILTTNVEINVQDIEIIPTIRIIVIGGPQVGKTALAVRYLTKRYPAPSSESFQSDYYYRQCIHFEGRRPVELEIIDVANIHGEVYNLPLHHLRVSDAVIVMYSITDRRSFESARDILEIVSDLCPSILTPVVLLGNKTDLNHLRKVSSFEGQNLAQRFNSSFHEVSVADSPTDTISILNSVIKELWNARNDGFDDNRTKKWGSTSAISRRRCVDDEDDEDDEYVNSQSQTQNTPTPSSITDDPRNRKTSVFDVSRRVFNNLIGRNSMPPDLPSSSSHKQSSMSLKNVFKKRSV